MRCAPSGLTASMTAAATISQRIDEYMIDGYRAESIPRLKVKKLARRVRPGMRAPLSYRIQRVTRLGTKQRRDRAVPPFEVGRAASLR